MTLVGASYAVVSKQIITKFVDIKTEAWDNHASAKNNQICEQSA